MVEPQLSPRAYLTLRVGRNLNAREKEIVAGVFRADARVERRNTQIREDIDVVTDAAWTPYAPSEKAA